MWTLATGCWDNPGYRISLVTLFLTAYILISWFFSLAYSEKATAERIEIVLNPKYPFIGEKVSLEPEGDIQHTLSCLWYKGDEELYADIILYLHGPTPEIFYLFGADVRHEVGENCSLIISNISYSDQALYGIVRNKTDKTEIGETFIRVLEEPHKHEPEAKTMTTPMIVGVIAGCTIGSIVFVAIITYQAAGSSGVVRELTWAMHVATETWSDHPRHRDAPPATVPETSPSRPSGMSFASKPSPPAKSVKITIS